MYPPEGIVNPYRAFTEDCTGVDDNVDITVGHQWLSRSTVDPLDPMRKSRSAPVLACVTWSIYSFDQPLVATGSGGFQAD
jgi:hypothetical protein